MCGIAGSINAQFKEAVPTMLAALAHRGPDDEGLYTDDARGVSLGHRRLAIIDLSAAGHQPMLSGTGEVVLVYNGETYNYKQLAEELKSHGCQFTSSSDTEVIVQGYHVWGTDVFKKIDGMWALALYDKQKGELHLSRDSAGIKPLYVYRSGSTILFASELGAFAALGVPLTVDASAASTFLAHGFLFGTQTIYTEVIMVPPATTLTINLKDNTTRSELNYVPHKNVQPATLEEATAQFNKLFAQSVRGTLQADVPVGLFLSGGMDSSLVGYQIQQAGASLTAFTAQFSERDFDESEIASQIAKHLGFKHEVIRIEGKEVAADALRVLDAFGEPFADMSALPTYCLSKYARERGAKVVLTGDGADELFGGYPTHYLPALAKWYRLSPAFADSALRGAAALMPHRYTKLGNREKLTRFLYGARLPLAEAHAEWKRIFTDTELHELLGEHTPPSDFALFAEQLRGSSGSDEDLVSKIDFLTFLPSSCLVKSDISSMQHGLEIRVPFLNKALIDFAWYLPTQFKVSPFKTKKVLRQALESSLPREITRLPKRGFVPPLAHWLAGDLRPLMQELLSERAIAKVGFLKYSLVASLIEEHLRGVDNAKKLWALMSLSRFYNRT